MDATITFTRGMWSVVGRWPIQNSVGHNMEHSIIIFGEVIIHIFEHILCFAGSFCAGNRAGSLYWYRNRVYYDWERPLRAAILRRAGAINTEWIDSTLIASNLKRCTHEIDDKENDCSCKLGTDLLFFLIHPDHLAFISMEQLREMPVDTASKPWALPEDEIRRRKDIRESHLVFRYEVAIDTKQCVEVCMNVNVCMYVYMLMYM